MSDTEKLNRDLYILQEKHKAYFGRMQNIYDCRPRSDSDPGIEMFLNKARNIDKLRSEFAALLDQLNELEIKCDPEKHVSFDSLWAFEDMFNCVNLLYCKYVTETETRNKTGSPSNRSIKLEQLNMPEFHGEVEKFPMFLESFNTMIHQNKDLDDSLRVRYLVSKLKGKAESIWLGINPTADNYNLIYNALIEKYQDNRAIAVAYLDKILNLKPLHSTNAQQLENFIDLFSTSVAALRQSKIENLIEFIFVHLGLRKIDSETAKAFEMSVRKKSMPSYDDFITFIREQVKIINRTNGQVSQSKSIYVPHKTSHKVHSFVVNNEKSVCCLCKSTQHEQLYFCQLFKDMNQNERFDFAKNNHLCVNCLSGKHRTFNCKSRFGCKYCTGRHHSLLCKNMSSSSKTVTNGQNNNIAQSSSLLSSKIESPEKDNIVSLCSISTKNMPRESPQKTALLGSAIIFVKDRNDLLRPIRALIDMGSQNNFITKNCCKVLGLKIFNSENVTSVKGIGESCQPIHGLTNIILYSHYDLNFCLPIQAFALNKISGNLPECNIDITTHSYLSSLPLADKKYFVPGSVDLLLGSQVFAEILKHGKVLGSPGKPDAIETAFGYVIIGCADKLQIEKTQQVNSFLVVEPELSLEKILTKFFETEDVPSKKHLSLADQECEQFYSANTKRLNSGRYVTALPFKISPRNLGDSHAMALRRFNYLERKLKAKDSNYKRQYDEVIKDYLNSGFISLVTELNKNAPYYIIPHHGVFREDSVTTKLRVVLDASAATTSGKSLNDCLHIGPNLQTDLTSIIMKFRLFPVAITADIKQMFLNIVISPEDRKYLRILYRFSEEEDTKVYEFNRVCFGLSCSPFLAMRTVKQLCMDEESKYPLAAKIASSDLYMDDLGTSVISIEEGITLAQDLIALFNLGGFSLVKFISNKPELLQSIPGENCLQSKVEFNKNDKLKILGLNWCPDDDVLSLSVKYSPDNCTKRTMLSTIAKLWDVNGYCAPVILYAKLLIRCLWLAKISWDESPPKDIESAWKKFQTELNALNQFKIPRFIGVSSNTDQLFLIGFSDASENAYGAVLYLCIVNNCTSNKVNLLFAKSKVAPVKVLSLCRLELCAILVMSKLVKFALETISSKCIVNNIYTFTDSSVALHWVHSSPHRFNTFVANRISMIQDNLSPKNIYHVSGKENPADCLSRGLTPAQLINHPLWCHGPSWLKENIDTWPTKTFIFDEKSDIALSECKSSVVNSFITISDSDLIFYSLGQRISSWPKLLLIAVYILRFVNKIQRSEFIQYNDLLIAEKFILKDLQTKYFNQDIQNLQKNKVVSKELKILSPFLRDGLIRVGGRLDKSALNFESKHPVLLPKNDHIVGLIIDHFHKNHFHAGPHLTLSLLRQKYWIISGRNIVRKIFRSCNKCFRANPRNKAPLMASLPTDRVNIAKPFNITGVDYAGPHFIVLNRYRGVKKSKVYFCLFSCFVTRAVHIEIAVDLTTESFLRAFRRFISRRGDCSTLYSDNGTNFIGAKAYLDELNKFLKSKNYVNSFANEIASKGITWKLNPPRASHFGGVFESEIRSLKIHLKRVIGESLLTYEELLTVITQIECVLNSRPLTSLSSDPSEATALTPAHFLFSGPLENFQTLFTDDNINSKILKRKTLLDNMVQHFWNRWSREYLTSLQKRQKWNTHSKDITIGTVVVLHMENILPLQWPLGIIEEVHSGSDGITRVVTVRTKSGTYVRPVVKVYPLPQQ